MLVDETGTVMYHKDENKNLRENIITELGYDQSLKIALQSNTETFLEGTYDNKMQRFYVQPVDKLPMHVIVYSDADYNRILDVQVFSLTSALYFLFFFLIFMQIGIFVLIHKRKKRKTKGHNIFVNWIWPDNKKRLIYQILSVYIILSVLYYFTVGLYLNIYGTFAFCSILISTNLISLNGLRNKKSGEQLMRYIIYYSIVFLAGIFMFVVSLEGNQSKLYGLRFLPVFIFSLIAILFSFLSFSNASNKRNFFKFGLDNKMNPISDRSVREVLSKNIRLYYNLYIFLVVMSLSIVPVLSFYSKSFNLEKDLYLRSLQLSLANNIVQEENEMDSDKLNKIKRLNQSVISIGGIQSKPSILMNEKNDEIIVEVVLDNYDSAHKIKSRISVSSQENQVLTKPEYKLLSTSRIPFDTSYYNAVSMDFLRHNSGRHYNWYTLNDSIIMFNNSINNYSSMTTHKNSLDIGNFKWHFDHPVKSLWLLVYLFVLLLMVYSFTAYWSRKIFLLRILQENTTFKSNLNEEYKIFLSDYGKSSKADQKIPVHSAKFIYLISPPYSGVLNYINENFDHHYTIRLTDAKNESYVMDELSNLDKSKHPVVVVLDTDSFTAELITLKTRLITELKTRIHSKKQLKKIIIVSATQPAYKITSLNKSGNEKNENAICFNNYMRVVGNFMRIYYPIGGFQNNNEDDVDDSREMNTGDDILTESLWNNWQKDQIYDDQEERLLNEQSLFHIYYYSIWNSLEDREQYLIYDLAQDGLANYRNIGIINNLMHKGILVNNNLRLRFFRKSFQNFILTNISREQSLQLELDSKRSGNWSNLKFPFIMIILSLFIFLFVTQQDLFNDLTGWLATAAASIPVLMRVFGGFTTLNLFGKKNPAN